jgi:hypothetical protein
MRLSNATAIICLALIGAEGVEGEEPTTTLDSALADHNLSVEQLLTEQNVFALGYHRGLAGAVFGAEQAPGEQGNEGWEPNAELLQALDDGYALGLEARGVSLSPPPSVVYDAFKAGEITPGAFAAWAKPLDLSSGFRLAATIQFGAGKAQTAVPAGTPIDMVMETTKDGVSAVIVGYDGGYLLVPSPEDSPAVVSADNEVTAKRRRKSGGTRKARAAGPKKERGPKLKEDGSGPGPLQDNGAFAARVRARCQELGIGDKARAFMLKADRHVPYYCNIYKPKQNGEYGRMGIEDPLAWVCAAIQHRSKFLRLDGESFEERLTNAPDELVAALQDRETRLPTTKPETVVKPESAEASA